MSEPSELIEQLSAAAQLMLRYSEGEKVREEALVLVEQGVSRTFLVFILLKKIG